LAPVLLGQIQPESGFRDVAPFDGDQSLVDQREMIFLVKVEQNMSCRSASSNA
jgi:hypothetical protein